MTEGAERRVSLPSPVDAAVVAGGVTVLREGARWWAQRFASGPASVAFVPDAAGVRARAWGPGAEEALQALPALLGAEDHGADGFVVGDPRLEEVARRAPEVRFGRTGRIWPALLQAVAGQRVTGRSAAASVRALRERYGDPAPGPTPGLRLPPDPARLAEATYPELHAHNLDRRRAELLIGLARRERRLQALTARPVAEALAALGTLPGVGPWTLGHVAAEVYGDADAVQLGDYHLPHHVAWVLTGEPRGTDEQMVRLLEPWRGHRGRVLRLLAHLPGPPRRGPRGDDPDLRRL